MEPRLSHLFCCRSGAAEHEEEGVRGRFLPRHPARTWSPESGRSSSPPSRSRMKRRHRRRRGEGARRRQETASSLRLRKWGGAMVWCPRIDGSAIQLSPAHRSAEAVGWDLAQFNVGCLTQRRCSFRSKEQEQNKSWMLKTWQ